MGKRRMGEGYPQMGLGWVRWMWNIIWFCHEQASLRLAYTIKEEDIPAALYINSDQTQVVYAQGSNFTWAKTGANTMLPLQAIYQGYSKASHPSPSAQDYENCIKAGFLLEHSNTKIITWLWDAFMTVNKPDIVKKSLTSYAVREKLRNLKVDDPQFWEELTSHTPQEMKDSTTSKNENKSKTQGVEKLNGRLILNTEAESMEFAVDVEDTDCEPDQVALGRGKRKKKANTLYSHRFWHHHDDGESIGANLIFNPNHYDGALQVFKNKSGAENITKLDSQKTKIQWLHTKWGTIRGLCEAVVVRDMSVSQPVAACIVSLADSLLLVGTTMVVYPVYLDDIIFHTISTYKDIAGLGLTPSTAQKVFHTHVHPDADKDFRAIAASSEYLKAHWSPKVQNLDKIASATSQPSWPPSPDQTQQLSLSW
ncbi:uncharacterized protein EDB91DRAFT_1087362 [Suillus paluster]|uniref:uncharacterized protein n=1 Tax=Suillus paluster TaxID=48578 RepID=UPI001B86D479|nr:uncharacterized protein EDB91DRAFT_1087362 [Suillus paluster]KAG1724689.1 hypothetical protein EDB91DRAFT_1087362 [Suillus paluster]